MFFFKQKTAYEIRISDWSSDVCSSDLTEFGIRDSGLGGRGIGFCRIPNPESPIPGCCSGLHPEQHPVRILELVLDVDQEQHRVLAVDDAVVVAQRDVHHRRRDHLAVLPRSEEHTSELLSLMRISYAVFCLK